MRNPLVGLVGVALVAATLIDMVWTTVAVSAGGGPVTSAVSHRIWRLFLRASRRSSRRHRFLRFAGVAVVAMLFVTWVSLLVVGWWLVFASSEGAVRNATTGAPVGWIDRLYYVGFTTSTLGVGDVVPGDGLWRVLTVVAAFSGLSVVTMSLTYLLPVASAVVGRRTLASTVAALGDRPSGIVVNAWRGGDWEVLERRLEDLADQVATLGQRHLAYPVLHFFHDLEPATAGPVAIASLDEALTLLRFGVAPEARPHPLVLDSTRATVASFLSTLEAGHIGPADAVPEEPSLEPLRAAGIPTVTDEEFVAACAGIQRRRRLLLGFVEDDGWTWDSLDDTRSGEGEDAPDSAAPAEVEDEGRDAA